LNPSGYLVIIILAEVPGLQVLDPLHQEWLPLEESAGPPNRAVLLVCESLPILNLES